MKLKLVSLLLSLVLPNFLFGAEVMMSVGEWAPYIGKKAPDNGMAAKIVSEAFKASGDKTLLRFTSWTKAKNNTAKSKTDGSFPWNLSSKRRAEFKVSDPFMTSKEVFFYLKSKGKINFEKLSDLKKYKVGAVQSYSHVDILKAAGINPKLSKKDLAGMKKMLKGKTDVFPCESSVGWDLINKHFPDMKDKVAIMEKPLGTQEMGIIFGKSNPKSDKNIESFNKGLKTIKSNGIYQNILNEFNYK